MKRRKKLFLLGLIAGFFVLFITFSFFDGWYAQGFMKFDRFLTTIPKKTLTVPKKLFKNKNIAQLLPNLSVKDISHGGKLVVTNETNTRTIGAKITICIFNKNNITIDVPVIITGQSGSVTIPVSRFTLADSDDCYYEIIPYSELLGNYFEGEFEIGENYEITVNIDPDNELNEIFENDNILTKNILIPRRGNFICDEGESNETNPFDCEMRCVSDYCNNDVQVYCACDNYQYAVNEHPCLRGGCAVQVDVPSGDARNRARGGNNANNENICLIENCGGREDLFTSYLEIQTRVYDCLSNYFDYQPNRVNYMVYPGSTEPVNNSDEEGRCCKEGGTASPEHILHKDLNGLIPFGFNHPNSPDELLPDVHETTHFFIYQMLHSIPGWFNEGLAIQTNERSGCLLEALPDNANPQVSQYALRGDSYLLEGPNDNDNLAVSGCINDNRCYSITEDYYEQLKRGEAPVNANEITGDHPIGAFFMIGLKRDYDCTEDCISEIVKKLHEYEMAQCQQSVECSVHPLFPEYSGSEVINNTIIKEKAEEVIGEDISPLFDLLDLEY